MGSKLAKAVLAHLPIQQIDEGERKRLDYQDMDSLIKDIAENGLINPIAVTDNNDGTYLIAAGGRRYRACVALGHTEIAARIYPEKLDELDLRTIELAENIHRAGLTYVEEVNLTREIHELQVAKYGEKKSTSPGAPGHSKADTAALLGRSASSVSEDIELAKAIEKLPALAQCKTKTDAKKTLSKIKEEIAHRELARRVETRLQAGGTNKAKQNLIDSYIVATVEEGCKGIEDSSIDLVEMDPPYAIELRKTVQLTEEQKEQLLGQDGGVSPDEYYPMLVAWYKLAYQKIRQNGWLISWYGIDPWHSYVLKAMREAGFAAGGVPGFWIKNNGNTRTPNIHLANAVESFIYGRKGSPVLNRMHHLNVFQYKMLTGKVHPNEKPVELYQDIFSTFCLPSSRIMVGFLGSGNAILGAANAGHSAVGFDMAGTYKPRYILKVNEGEIGKYTSY